jgi:hypothetical protein
MRANANEFQVKHAGNGARLWEAKRTRTKRTRYVRR